MTKPLSQFLASRPSPAQPPLHLVHCTSVGASIDILNDGRIAPKPCPVYGADLLYLFYGRPAYRPGAGLPASGIIDLAPVCLILDPNVLTAAVRVLPFDSGGFKRYEPLLGPHLKLPEFELGVDTSAPLRLIEAFYQTNTNYYDQLPTLSEAELPVSKVAARAYARLIADPSLRAVDDRCGTIEVQFPTEISLKSALKAVIGPAALLSDPEVRDALKDCPGVLPLAYKTYGRSEPVAFAQALYERVETYLRDQGCFP